MWFRVQSLGLEWGPRKNSAVQEEGNGDDVTARFIVVVEHHGGHQARCFTGLTLLRFLYTHFFTYLFLYIKYKYLSHCTIRVPGC